MAEKQAHQWQESSSKFVDAYIDWVRETAKRLLDPKDEVRTVPVLVSLQPGKTKRDFLSEFEHLLRQSPDKPDDGGVPADLERSQFTLRVRCEALERLKDVSTNNQLTHRIAIAHDLPCHAAPKDRRGVKKADDSEQEPAVGKYEPHDGSPVVMGIIDEGIAFANQRFRNGPEDSRVEYAWIQDGQARGEVLYGLELTKADIDESLGKCVSGGQVDEDLFYSMTGVVDFGQTAHKATARRAGHGTHVMDLACGYDEGSLLTSREGTTKEGRVQRPIVCVKLPTVTVAETSGIGLEYYVLDGVDYILRRAQDIARRLRCNELPVVINFSSGILAGPRDGTQPIERAIDDRIFRRTAIAPTDVVLPAGNSRLSRLHARISLSPKGEKGCMQELQFRVLPDDRTCSYLEIWLPTLPRPSSKDWMEITLEPPGGERSLVLGAGAGKRAMQWAPHGDVLCKVYYEFIAPPTNRGRYVIALLPTDLPDCEHQLAPFGTWTIAFKNLMNRRIDVEASIQWDDRPLGYPQNGRQSYFVDDCYQRFEEISGEEEETDNNSAIKRDGSMNAIATGSRAITAGGYVRKQNRVVKYSAGGPISLTGSTAKKVAGLERSGPDGLARSDESYVHQGMLAAGTRSGSVVVMNGTSVAAPQIARQIAKEREKGNVAPGREIARELAAEIEGQKGQVHVLGGDRDPPEILQQRRGSGRAVTLEIEREVQRLDRLSID
jgi:hypothetical protein